MTFMSGLRSTYKTFRNICRFIDYERRRSRSAFSRRGLLCKGLFSQRAELYKLDDHDPEWFLTDWEVEFKLRHVNRIEARHVLADKLYMHLLLGKTYTPQFLGYLDHNGFHACSSFAELESAIEHYGKIFIKPSISHGGRGVKVIKKASEAKVETRYVVEAPITCHHYANCIFPGTLNTIRIMTLRDAEGCFVAGASHRFGTSATIPVDNFSQGGIAAPIDMDNGILAAGRSNPGVFRCNYHSVHPDSGVAIEGASIPYWQETCALVAHLAEYFHELFMVGWDIAITDKGPILVEGNPVLPNPNILQLNVPLLKNARILRFMYEHNVVSKRKYVNLKRKM